MLEPTQQLTKTSFITFDTETTGLNPVIGKLVEIGAVRFNADGDEIAVFDQLINPETSIPPDAQAVNHITDEMVRDQPTAESVLPRFLDFLGPAEHVLIAQNAPFDIGFIGVALLRCGLALPAHPVFDTKRVAITLMPGLMSHSLETLGSLLGVTTAQEHRALSDARLTKNVFLALLAKAPGVKTLVDLARLSPPVTFERARMHRAKPPQGFEDLETAIREQRPIVMVYEGGTRGEEPRQVTPRALLQYNGIIYLAAYCHADSREKVYRLDRIREFHLAS
jgi:DNA polymerase III epsilon subunit family exonuclease